MFIPLGVKAGMPVKCWEFGGETLGIPGETKFAHKRGRLHLNPARGERELAIDPGEMRTASCKPFALCYNHPVSSLPASGRHDSYFIGRADRNDLHHR